MNDVKRFKVIKTFATDSRIYTEGDIILVSINLSRVRIFNPFDGLIEIIDQANYWEPLYLKEEKL